MNVAVLRAWGKNLPKLKSYAEKPWFYPAALLLIGLVAYGYQVGLLGFYWDDWEVVFLLNSRNLSLLYSYFAFDRPFAWPYQLMYVLFGLQPVAWHLITLLLRWAAIFLFYLSLKQVWPRYDAYLRWMGVLLLVYPGFYQQSISTAYQRHFTAFFLFMLSVYLMVLAVRHPARAWFLFPLSWVAALIQIFTIEYFVGLELISPVIFWLLLTADGKTGGRNAVGKTVLLSLPYLVLFGFYFWWRLIIFPATITKLNYAGDFKMLGDFQISFLGGALALLTRAFFDFIYSTLQVWLTGLTTQDGFTFQSKAVWFAFAVGILVAAIFALFQDVDVQGEQENHRSSLPLFLFGCWAFLVSSLPIWLTSKQLSGGGRWDDRFALATMPGAILMTLAAIIWLIRAHQRKLVLTLLLLLSTATQVLIVNRYRLDWQAQRDYYWQLAWRVPALKPETAILSFEQPSASIPGYDASFALNVLFDGTVVDGVVPYWFFTNDRFLNFELVPGKRITYADRNLEFTGNTSNAISIVRQGENRCLQVLDTAYTGQPFYETDQERLIGVSNVARIIPDAGADPPNPEVFGAEPPHFWCYYFEKADLARQFGDWQSVLKLEKQAKSQGLAARFGPEFVPFIEAHARTGDWQKAYDLSLAAQSATKEMNPLLCSTWERLTKLPSADAGLIDRAKQSFTCGNP
jgi:uncharacterized membrane protein YvlD (DUF360 family)